MKRLLILIAVLFMSGSVAWAEDKPKVYSNEDLQKYSKGITPKTDEELARDRARRKAEEDKYWAEEEQRMINDVNMKYAEIEAKQKRKQRQRQISIEGDRKRREIEQQYKIEQMDREIRNMKWDQIN